MIAPLSIKGYQFDGEEVDAGCSSSMLCMRAAIVISMRSSKGWPNYT
jgi:hypothetical protein